MVKAQDFWDYLCNDLDYRFFAGIPCDDLNFLYNTMNSDLMHYIPAVDINIALSMVNGAMIAGTKGALIMPPKLSTNLDLRFNIKFDLPIIILSSDKVSCGLDNIFIDDSNFKAVLKDLVVGRMSAALFFGEV